MEDLSLRLEALGFIADEFELRDIGDGPFIYRWMSEKPQPGISALRAVTAPQIEVARALRFRQQPDLGGVADAIFEAVASRVPGVSKADLEGAFAARLEARRGR